MKYDFIEIGTSNFSTLIENATNDTVGISVEPVKYYLNQLPDKFKVKKLNCAISKNGREEIAEVYYVPEKEIEKNKLPEWLKGCNSVNGYHLQHTLLKIQHLVKREKIRSIPISSLFIEHQVEELDFLKIDTEGQDVEILENLFSFLENRSKLSYPKKILFESNQLVSQESVLNLIEKYKKLDYFVVYSNHDTLLELQL